MTALFMDGFDHYGSGNQGQLNMLDGTWAETPGQFAGPGVPGWGAATGSLSIMSQPISSVYRYVLPATQSNLFISLRYSTTNLPTGNNVNRVIEFRDNTNATIVRLVMQSTGVDRK